MTPTFGKRRSRLLGESKSGHDSSSIPSKESASRTFIVQVFYLMLKSAKQKKTNTMTEDGNSEKDIYSEAVSPESAWNSYPNTPQDVGPYAELEVTEIAEVKVAELEAKATELVTPLVDASPQVSSRPSGYGGTGSAPGSQRSGSVRTYGGASYAQGPTTPGHRSNSRHTTATGPGQGYYVDPRAYYDPDYPSIPEKALISGNTNTSNGVQVIGADVGLSSPQDLRSVTANILADGNLHSGTGSQIVGQRVNHGAAPRLFAGTYTNNVNTTGGEQILGILCY
ncbi:hypothetical protein GGR55DRAFT_256485 [Xylaria sp. FL0064]|nr:hypothetical protein GGR55DRAFT_256485 [Xylaria sp. FL0064]